MTNAMTPESSSWIVETWSQTTPANPKRQPEGISEDGAELRAEIVVRTMTQMLQCSDPEAACRLLANRLQQFLGCRQVAVGLSPRHRRRCRIRGLSGVVRFDSHTRFITAIQDALEETLAHELEMEWPQREEADQPTALAHEKLIGVLGAECVASLPLRDGDGQVVGAVLFVDEPAESAFALINRFGAALASCLAALELQQIGYMTRHVRRLRAKLASWRGRTVGLSILFAALLLMVPWPYRVSCESQIQPVKRRYVVAPYDGTLASSVASPGDVVRAGDVLATMDEREIRWELASLEADFARAEKERDAAMAAHRTSAAQLAELEMERLDVQIKRQQHRIDNLAIRSPIDGIVVAGDLEKAQGAPLTIGQALFEVAPLDEMSIEVNVPEEDIAYVAAGMDVEVTLEAFPSEQINGTLKRVHPQAEIRDKESVFVAEFELANRDGRLRPGMNGWAEVTGKKRSLGWILFHKPWGSMRRALAW